jgi:hypothetical protein
VAVDSGFLRIDARTNLTALGNAIEHNVASIQGSTTLSQADKDRLSAEWKKLETDLQNSNNLSLAAEVVPAALLAAAGGLAGWTAITPLTALVGRFGLQIVAPALPLILKFVPETVKTLPAQSQLQKLDIEQEVID